MPFRVSTTQIIDQSLYGINSAFNRFDVAQQRVNTGRQLNTPSDDPSAASAEASTTFAGSKPQQPTLVDAVSVTPSA